MLLAGASSLAQAQSMSLTAGNASGDCNGTSFSQGADASGKFLSIEWAGAGQFPIPINRGRVRCSIRLTVTVQTGYKLVPGGAMATPNRLAIAQVMPLRLNGATSGVLIESAIAIDNGTPATAGHVTSGGPMTSAGLLVDRSSSSPVLESACSTAAKSTFQMSAVVDMAAASNYVVPWPPEAYAERETASMSYVRLFYNVVPCATRSVSPQRGM